MQAHANTIDNLVKPFFKLYLLLNASNTKNNRIVKNVILGIVNEFELFDINIINQFSHSSKGFIKINT